MMLGGRRFVSPGLKRIQINQLINMAAEGQGRLLARILIWEILPQSFAVSLNDLVMTRLLIK